MYMQQQTGFPFNSAKMNKNVCINPREQREELEDMEEEGKEEEEGGMHESAKMPSKRCQMPEVRCWMMEQRSEMEVRQAIRRTGEGAKERQRREEL